MIKHLNEDLSREYQAIIAYVVYSQVLKGAEYMNIASELEVHAAQELQHAITIAKYLGGMPSVTADAGEEHGQTQGELQADLDNEAETIRNYRERVKAGSRECFR